MARRRTCGSGASKRWDMLELWVWGLTVRNWGLRVFEEQGGGRNARKKGPTQGSALIAVHGGSHMFPPLSACMMELRSVHPSALLCWAPFCPLSRCLCYWLWCILCKGEGPSQGGNVIYNGMAVSQAASEIMCVRMSTTTRLLHRVFSLNFANPAELFRCCLPSPPDVLFFILHI